MHSAVMQNGKYIDFANEHTVEVVCEGSLDKGVEAKDPKAATYKTKGPDGQEVEYMVEWPNLTLEEMTKLASSPAGSFNKSGKIPYTSIVNPWDLSEMKSFLGGTSGKAIIEACEEAQKSLTAEHGKGVSRADLKTVDAAVATSKTQSEAKDFAKALDDLSKVEKKFAQAPEAITSKLTEAKDTVLKAARSRLDEVKAMEAPAAKKELSKLMNKLKGTGLEEEAREFLKSLSAE